MTPSDVSAHKSSLELKTAAFPVNGAGTFPSTITYKQASCHPFPPTLHNIVASSTLWRGRPELLT